MLLLLCFWFVCPTSRPPPPFFFFLLAFLSCFNFMWFSLDRISLLLHFPFQTNLSSLSRYFPCRIYYQPCFLLTAPVPAPHLARWRWDGVAEAGSDRSPGAATATWVTGTVSPFAPPPLLLPSCSFFAFHTWLGFSPVLSPPRRLCLHTLQRERGQKPFRQVQPGSARAGAASAMGLTLGGHRLSRLGTGPCSSSV